LHSLVRLAPNETGTRRYKREFRRKKFERAGAMQARTNRANLRRSNALCGPDRARLSFVLRSKVPSAASPARSPSQNYVSWIRRSLGAQKSTLASREDLRCASFRQTRELECCALAGVHHGFFCCKLWPTIPRWHNDQRAWPPPLALAVEWPVPRTGATGRPGPNGVCPRSRPR